MPAVTPCVICGTCGGTIDVPEGYGSVKPFMVAHDKVCAGQSQPSKRPPAKDVQLIVKRKRLKRTPAVADPINELMRTVGEQLGRAAAGAVLEWWKKR